MILLQKMYHYDGKIVIQDIDGRWFQLTCVTSDLVCDSFGDVIATRIEPPVVEQMENEKS